MGKSPEVMILNGDRTFSLGKGRDFYYYPDGMKGCFIESEKHGVIEIRCTSLQAEVLKDPAAPKFENIFINLPPQCLFSRS